LKGADEEEEEGVDGGVDKPLSPTDEEAALPSAERREWQVFVAQHFWRETSGMAKKKTAKEIAGPPTNSPASQSDGPVRVGKWSLAVRGSVESA